jgi:hypothetical protein
MANTTTTTAFYRVILTVKYLDSQTNMPHTKQEISRPFTTLAAARGYRTRNTPYATWIETWHGEKNILSRTAIIQESPVAWADTDK